MGDDDDEDDNGDDDDGDDNDDDDGDDDDGDDDDVGALSSRSHSRMMMGIVIDTHYHQTHYRDTRLGQQEDR